MSKLSTTKKLILEDYPAEVRPWFGKVVDILNRFLEQVYFALVNGLTTIDNLKAQSNTVSVSANQVYPIKFAWTLNERPTAVWVVNISESTGAAVPAFSTSWVYDNGTIKLTLNGLTAASKYTIKTLGLV